MRYTKRTQNLLSFYQAQSKTAYFGLADEEKTTVHTMPERVKVIEEKTILKPSVVLGDCLVTVKEEIAQGNKVCLLNMANEFRPGGGVRSGSEAQEEHLCRHTSLFYSLEKNFEHYPLTDKLLYTENVFFISDYKKKNPFDVITIPAFNLGKFKPEGYSLKTKNRIEFLLKIPQLYKVDTLILSAFGCGAFKNDPEYIAKTFKNIISTTPYSYKKIIFAIYDDANASEKGNYKTFKRILSE